MTVDMTVDFKNLNDFVIPLMDFSLNWRFTDSRFNLLSSSDLKVLKPLNKVASRFISNYLVETDLHGDFPFKTGFFRQVDSINITMTNSEKIKEWLLKREKELKYDVIVSWDSELAMIVPYSILVDHFDDFFYSASDDMTVFQNKLEWALLFSHDDNIYYGTK